MIASALFMADTPAVADAAKTDAPPAKAADAPAAKPKVVCHTESVTGSLTPKKTCYNVEQSAERKQEERQDLEKMQHR
ncbi:hypothetical protein [Phenylobacterium sp.]|uniref:hypothetical protein n=1 Tax=Phenylobacterium sp. TaxID=1871053 RepID=UPI0012114316|nr:hypothetical protein [Phenylobacterium sp.]THD61602.1 MAG: hypothetical protein E8A49_11565 [Phenylobacterium sp.]